MHASGGKAILGILVAKSFGYTSSIGLLHTSASLLHTPIDWLYLENLE